MKPLSVFFVIAVLLLVAPACLALAGGGFNTQIASFGAVPEPAAILLVGGVLFTIASLMRVRAVR